MSSPVWTHAHIHKYTGREHTGDKSEHDAEREYWAKKKRAKLAEDRKQELERQKKIEADRVAHQKAMEAERERKAERKKQKRAKKEARKAKKKKKRKKKKKKKEKTQKVSLTTCMYTSYCLMFFSITQHQLCCCSHHEHQLWIIDM